MKNALLAFALVVFASPPLTAQVDPALLAGMKARSIGPAAMSGRVAAVDALNSDPNIIYIGAATGGVWKSTDGGHTWKPIFDEEPVAAIGAVAINQSNADLVWVGTGEANPRNSASVGNGVFRSLDGGVTWNAVGLEGTERISRIVLHPDVPNTAWVAAMGRAWGENPERGVFKTTDGGRTWTKVLYVDPRTGAADLIIDPSNPNKLFAAMWDYRRWPWFFRSGGPGSGLYVTQDGGANWKRLTEDDGLPKGRLGRIGLAIAASNPSIVYALVEAEKSALIRSDDGGKTWKTRNEESDIASRPFYYADIEVDPQDPNRVYNLYSLINVSEDGGKTFRVLVPFQKVHPDHHALWINPNDPRHLINGNDGGVAVSHDRGETWRFVGNLPLAQYYHINVDQAVPYNVYGGMQDNGSWRGPSEVWENGGIRNHHWQEVGFGDGFATLAIDGERLTGYAMSQEGNLMRWDYETGERKDIRPANPEGVTLRFNWNAGIAIDPFDPNTVYYGSQFVHKSTDRGENWTIISPDLTTNNPNWQHQARSGGLTLDVTGAENFTTILTIAPSALERGLIWVGTDDGRVHLTRDGGATWSSVESGLRGAPPNTWVAHIEPSKHEPGRAYAVLDDHRRSNWTPYVYRTTDYGRSWTNLASREVRGYALTLEEDPVNRDLLFLGTEFGLWVTLDGGRRWIQWTHGFPTVSAMAMTIQPQEHDLVVGTHGRAAYILDDIRPLRTLSAETMRKPVHLFEIPDAQQYRVRQTGSSRFAGDTEFRGTNEPYGALLTYSLNFDDLPHPDEEKERERKAAKREEEKKPELITAEGIPQDVETLPKGPEERVVEDEMRPEQKKDDKGPQVTIEVKDAAGKLVRSFKGPANRGVNRTNWNLRSKGFREPPRERTFFLDDPSGPEVVPGNYTVTVKYKDQEASAPVRVLPDPRVAVPPAARQQNWDMRMRAGALQEALVDAIVRVQRTRADIDAVNAKIQAAAEAKRRAEQEGSSEKNEANPLVRRGNELKKQLDALEKELWVPPKTKGIVADTDALSKVERVQYSLGSSWDAPTAAQMRYFAEAEAKTREMVNKVNELFAGAVAEYRSAVRTEAVVLLPEMEPITVEPPR